MTKLLVVSAARLLCQIEHLELFAHLLELQRQILHLKSHGLVVLDQGLFLLLIGTNLFDKVLSCRSLVWGLLAES